MTNLNTQISWWPQVSSPELYEKTYHDSVENIAKPVETKYTYTKESLKKALIDHIVKIDFYKVNTNKIRTMICTLRKDILAIMDKNEDRIVSYDEAKQEGINLNGTENTSWRVQIQSGKGYIHIEANSVVCVYDLEKKDFRAFRIDKVISCVLDKKLEHDYLVKMFPMTNATVKMEKSIKGESI